MARSRNLLVLILAFVLLAVVGGLGLFVLQDDGAPYDEPTDAVPAEGDADGGKGAASGRKPKNVATALQQGDVPAIALEAGGGEIPDEPFDPDAAEVPITYPLEVHVSLADGTHAAGARVTVHSGFGPIDVPAEDAGEETAADGTAVFALTDPAFVRVYARLGDQVALGERAAVQSQDGTRVDLVLDEGVVVQGRVTQDGGRALPAAVVTARMASPDPFGVEVKAKATDEGRFRAPALPRSLLRAGGHVLTASARGFVAASVEADLRLATGGDLEIELVRGLVVRGRCVSTRGDPVGRVLVRAVVPTAHTTSDADGAFELDGVPPDGRPLIFVPQEHAPRIYERVPAQVGEIEIGDVVLEEGVSIPGIVVDASGEPLPGAKIEALSEEIGLPIRTVVSGDDGRFELAHLASSAHTLTATEGGEDVAWSERRSTTLPGVMPEAGEIRIALSGGLSVHLTFQSEADRSPVVVPSVRLEARPSGADGDADYAWAWSGAKIADVRFKVREAGVFDIQVEIPGYAAGVATGVSVSAETETRIDVLFRKLPE